MSDEYRGRAREDVAKQIMEHDRKMGKHTTYEQAKRYANQRADRIDAHKDRNYKGGVPEKD